MKTRMTSYLPHPSMALVLMVSIAAAMAYGGNNPLQGVPSLASLGAQAGPLTGDVVTSGAAATIAAGVVTNSKIADGTIFLPTKVAGTLPVGNGGTGATNTADALTAFGAQAGPLTGDVTTSGAAATIAALAVTGAKIAAGTIDLTTKVSGRLPVANGGTGSNSASAARAALGAPVGGIGFPVIVSAGRVVATTTAIPVGAPITSFLVGGSDGSFIVSGGVLVTADTATTLQLQISYTDEGGTSRDPLVINLSSLAGVLAPGIAATGVYEGIPLHIRAKAGTTISVYTAFTINSSMTYNVEAVVQQLQ